MTFDQLHNIGTRAVACQSLPDLEYGEMILWILASELPEYRKIFIATLVVDALNMERYR